MDGQTELRGIALVFILSISVWVHATSYHIAAIKGSGRQRQGAACHPMIKVTLWSIALIAVNLISVAILL